MDIIKELKKDGMLLKKIPKKEQSVDICKTAIRQNPLALQFIFSEYLNLKIYLIAVKKMDWHFRNCLMPIGSKMALFGENVNSILNIAIKIGEN